MDKKTFALLINADNISPAYLRVILQEAAKYGELTVKKIYGDWIGSNKRSWKELLAKNCVVAVQECNPESSITMEALDILAEDSVNGFIIASFDSDFSRLAKRAQSAGKTVIGMGDETTPVDFVNICDDFVTFMVETASMGKGADGNVAHDGSPQEDIGAGFCGSVCEEYAGELSCNHDGTVQEAQGKNGKTEKNQRDVQADQESAGKESVGKAVEEAIREVIEEVLEKDRAEETVLADIHDVEQYILELLESDGFNGKILLEKLALILREKFPDFSHKKYGYAKFPKFIESLSSLQIVTAEPQYELGMPPMYVLKKSDEETGGENDTADNMSLKLRLKENVYPDVTLEEIETFILDLLEQEEYNGRLLLGLANHLLMKQYPGFNQRQFGLAKFNKFIELLPGVTMLVEEDVEGKTSRTYIIKK